MDPNMRQQINSPLKEFVAPFTCERPTGSFLIRGHAQLQNKKEEPEHGQMVPKKLTVMQVSGLHFSIVQGGAEWGMQFLLLIESGFFSPSKCQKIPDLHVNYICIMKQYSEMPNTPF
jgi:hypothetical protein